MNWVLVHGVDVGSLSFDPVSNGLGKMAKELGFF
mgnify:CR=1 FL=1